MKLKTIISIGKEIRAAYDHKSPELLCSELSVTLLYYPMGTAKKSVKGFILKYNDRTAITINSDLSDIMRKVVFYHEIAHYILHIRTGLCENINDCEIYDAVSGAEYEANMLASELQISDDDAVYAIMNSGSFEEAAALLNVPDVLLSFKVKLLNEKGYAFPEPPVGASGCYLGNFTEKECVS